MRTSSIRLSNISLLTVVTLLLATCKFIDWPSGGGPGDPGTIYKTVKHVSTTRLKSPRYGIIVASANNKIYIAGGYLLDSLRNYIYSNILDIYDEATDSWSTDSMPVDRYFGTAVALNNKIYFGGGGTHYDELNIYDVITRKWERDSVPTSGYGISAAGGQQVLFQNGDFRNRNIYLFDVLTHSWSNYQAIDARLNGVAIKAANELWFAGGQNNVLGDPVLNSIDIYDLSNQTWRRDHMPRPKSYMAAGQAGNQLLFAGGYDGIPGIGYSKIVEVFDLTTRKWRIDSLSAGKFQPGAAAIGNFILFAGGQPLPNLADSKRVDIYNAATGKWSIDSLTKAGYVQGAAVGNKILFISNSFGGEAPENIVDIYEVK